VSAFCLVQLKMIAAVSPRRALPALATADRLQSATRCSTVLRVAGMYNLKDLLNLVAQEGAEELRLEPDRPPMMLLHGKVRVLDGPLVSSDQVTELFRGIATEEQRHELELCGNTHFHYAAEHSTQFSVRAGVQDDRLSLTIKNLAR
jgi:Tfp pilus assembly ATPase PilU